MCQKIDTDFLQHIILLLKTVTGEEKDTETLNSSTLNTAHVTPESTSALENQFQNLNAVNVKLVSNNTSETPNDLHLLPCTLCNKKFKLRILLNAHMKIHNLMKKNVITK